MMNKQTFADILTADLIYESADALFEASVAEWDDLDTSGDYKWKTDKSIYIQSQALFIPSFTCFTCKEDGTVLLL